MIATRKIHYWLSISLLLIAGYCCAMPVQRLNEAEIPVVDHSAARFNAALVEAFSEVMIKISGNVSVTTIPQVQNFLPHAKNYLLSYSYHRVVDPSSKQLTLSLHMRFDEDSIKKLLRQSAQTVLGRDRPLTLLIVSIPQGVDWQILSDSKALLAQTLEDAAKRRGLPVVLPMMDLSDQAMLSQANGTMLTLSQLQWLEKRYRVNSILYGTVSDDASSPQLINWQCAMDGISYHWETQGDSVQQAAVIGIDHLLETVAQEYAAMSSPKLLTDIIIQITGINGLKDYVNVVSKIRHLNPVANVAVKDMSFSEVLLRVTVSGGEVSFMKAMREELNLSPLATPSSLTMAYNPDLTYVWGKTQQ